MIPYFTIGLKSFLLITENPQQFILHLMSGNLSIVFFFRSHRARTKSPFRDCWYASCYLFLPPVIPRYPCLYLPFFSPNSSAISLVVSPASHISTLCLFNCFTCVFFLLAITMPLYVVMILHKGAFCLLSVFTGSVQVGTHFTRKLSWDRG